MSQLVSPPERRSGVLPRSDPEDHWWERGREPAHSVAALGMAVTLTLVVVDVYLSDTVGVLFDLGFVTLCCALALRVRPGDFIFAGLIPPVVMITAFALLGFGAPDVVGHPRDGVVQTVVSGISHHSPALFVGYALCLALLAYRQHLLTRP